MDDDSVVRGPVELDSLGGMPRDTLVREVGTTKWIPIHLARKFAARTAPVATQAQAEPTPAEKPWAAAIIVAAAGLILGSYCMAAGNWVAGMVWYCLLWSGLSAMVAMGSRQKASVGFLMGGLLGPLGFLMVVGVAIYKMAGD